jgi:nucleoside 2-deoxyribosyltransferase
MRPKVYLAGPIAGLTYDEGQDWRTYAQAVLEGANIDGFSPLRGKQFLRAAGKIGTAGFAHALASDKGIMKRDTNDVRTSAVVLVNFVGATKISRGTDMELMAAYILNIPVVVACPEDSIMLDHPMVRAAVDYRVDTLDDALEVIQTIVNPGPRVPWARPRNIEGF